MEIHIARKSYDFYQFDSAWFSSRLDKVFADSTAARKVANQMISKQMQAQMDGSEISAGQINAMGLLIEAYHRLFTWYLENIDPQLPDKANTWMEHKLDAALLTDLYRKFETAYPTPHTYFQENPEISSQKQIDSKSALNALTIFLVIQNNPALLKIDQLFNDRELKTSPIYQAAIQQLQAFHNASVPTGTSGAKNLLDLLLAPAKRHPNSLTEQLQYIQGEYGDLLADLLEQILQSLDMLKEDERWVFPASTPLPPSFDEPMFDPAQQEKFSIDLDWMDSLVLIAKNAYVWMHQLSLKYGYYITRLNQIPDQELDLLASQGFTGLWLIGLWQRSQASARIKQMCGNPEALASAYSLYDYRIADELGGEAAFNDLKYRALKRGIRMASDLVPNHMGIDSPWLVEHPEWFLSLETCPYPNYSFNGPDLSSDPRIGIFIEDHYYDRTDAAVVFKRVDHQTGKVLYVYHGNDGTSMPWNDTAQLNYLNPAVREQVLQTILRVSRLSPIIRFDAAMTLTKLHYQRLWYPQPGSGGDIPTRAEHGMSKEEFDRLFPVEFWQEVVERIGKENPDTLLMAEAFWLMENFFVRTLGMHRVYNSAFMHLMRDENNSKYQAILASTLEFSPAIMKRYVNFMNNPDEQTAIEQFGKHDKYFGICTFMCTLPGLPMFGHGQIEGYREKYGMEYKRAYLDELPDLDLIHQHEIRLFPILHRRHQFSGIENFRMYPFNTPYDGVNKNVYAYSNDLAGQRSLVFFNNSSQKTAGKIYYSMPFHQKTSTEDFIQTTTIIDALHVLPQDKNAYLVYRDLQQNLQFILPVSKLLEHGVELELYPYETKVWVDVHIRQDDDQRMLKKAADHLNGSGTPNLYQMISEMRYWPLQQAVREALNPGYFAYLQQQLSSNISTSPESAFIVEARQKQENILLEARKLVPYPSQWVHSNVELPKGLAAIQDVLNHGESDKPEWSRSRVKNLQSLHQSLEQHPALLPFLLSWLHLHPLQHLDQHDWVSALHLDSTLSETLAELNQAASALVAPPTWLKFFTSQGDITVPRLAELLAGLTSKPAADEDEDQDEDEIAQTAKLEHKKAYFMKISAIWLAYLDSITSAQYSRVEKAEHQVVLANYLHELQSLEDDSID